MTEADARRILGTAVQLDGSLSDPMLRYIHWGVGRPTASLDGYFSAEELEAIAWFMRQSPAGPQEPAS